MHFDDVCRNLGNCRGDAEKLPKDLAIFYIIWNKDLFKNHCYSAIRMLFSRNGSDQGGN